MEGPSSREDIRMCQGPEKNESVDESVVIEDHSFAPSLSHLIQILAPQGVNPRVR